MLTLWPIILEKIQNIIMIKSNDLPKQNLEATILIVDDQISNLKVLAILLKKKQL